MFSFNGAAIVTIFSLTVANWDLNIDYSTLAAARLKFDWGDYAGAIPFYDLAIRADKKNAAAIFQRGKCHQFLGNYRHAIEDYNRTMFIDPDQAEVYYMLGLLHDLVGRQSLAVFNYCEAISLDPSHAEAIVSRSFAYYELYGVETVISDLKVALDLFLDRGNYVRAKDMVDSIAMLSSQIN